MQKVFASQTFENLRNSDGYVTLDAVWTLMHNIDRLGAPAECSDVINGAITIK